MELNIEITPEDVKYYGDFCIQKEIFEGFSNLGISLCGVTKDTYGDMIISWKDRRNRIRAYRTSIRWLHWKIRIYAFFGCTVKIRLYLIRTILTPHLHKDLHDRTA